MRVIIAKALNLKIIPLRILEIQSSASQSENASNNSASTPTPEGTRFFAGLFSLLTSIANAPVRLVHACMDLFSHKNSDNTATEGTASTPSGTNSTDPSDEGNNSKGTQPENNSTENSEDTASARSMVFQIVGKFYSNCICLRNYTSI
jgi:hypothetical protein